MDSLFNCICVLLSFSRVNCEDVVTEDFVSEDAEGFLMEYLGISITDAILYSVLLAGGYWFYQRNNTSDTSPAAVIHINRNVVSQKGGSATDEDGFISRMKKSESKVAIFYGSQTGTAEEFAGRAKKEMSKYGLKATVIDPEEVDLAELSELVNEIPDHLAVFFMATYGEGDPTDNAINLFKMVTEEEPDYAGLNYCVFALGNRTYEQYNYIGRVMDKRLEELGATRIFPIGEGDDDQNMEDDFVTWKDELMPKICEVFGLDTAGQDMSMRQYTLKELEDYEPSRVYTGQMSKLNSYQPEKQMGNFDQKHPYLSKVLVNRELHSNSGRNCMHIELDLGTSRIKYEAGDHVAVFPQNNLQQVERLCALLEKDPETVFSLTDMDEFSSKKSPFPCPCSYRTALLHYVDISSVPRTHVLKEFLRHTSGEEDLAKLTLLTGKTEEGKALYQAWVVAASRSPLQILEELPTCRPPLDLLCEMLPRLQARYYSISSSPHAHPKNIHITAVVLTYPTPFGSYEGVATNWLLRQQQLSATDQETEHKVPMFVRKSQFRLPIRLSVPCVMIGPGTGIAPFRGFLQQRNKALQNGDNIGKMVLYYGCRNKDQDFLYREELEQYEQSGLVTLRLAFSRDQPEKVYVQDLLNQDKEMLWDIIDGQKGNLYVCGDAKNMAREVNSAIISCVKEQGGKTTQQAEDYVKKLIQNKRYSSDVWS